MCGARCPTPAAPAAPPRLPDTQVIRPTERVQCACGTGPRVQGSRGTVRYPRGNRFGLWGHEGCGIGSGGGVGGGEGAPGELAVLQQRQPGTPQLPSGMPPGPTHNAFLWRHILFVFNVRREHSAAKASRGSQDGAQRYVVVRRTTLLRPVERKGTATYHAAVPQPRSSCILAGPPAAGRPEQRVAAGGGGACAMMGFSDSPNGRGGAGTSALPPLCTASAPAPCAGCAAASMTPSSMGNCMTPYNPDHCPAPEIHGISDE